MPDHDKLQVLEQGERLRLALVAEVATVEPVRQAVLDHLAPLMLSLQAIYSVELVLEETLLNVSTHAFGDEPARPCHLTVEADDDDSVSLQFEDDGMAFDPTQAEEPVVPGSLQLARPGGLGLALVRKRARSVAYERSDDGRNRLTIVIARA